MNNKWSPEEKQFIIDNADTIKDVEMARTLTKMSGRIVTLQAVRKQRQKLGVAKKAGRGICSTVKSKSQEKRFISQTIQKVSIDTDESADFVGETA